MTTAEAILRLRKHLKMTQPEFAEACGRGISLRSICRYEKGSSPGAAAMMSFRDLAQRNGVDHIYKLFDALLATHNVVQAETQQRKLQSPGTARRIPFDQLLRWCRDSEEARAAVESAIKLADLKTKTARQPDPKELVQALQTVQQNLMVAHAAREGVLDELLLFVLGPGPATSDRLEAVKCILHPELLGSKASREVVDKYIAGPTPRDNAKRLNKGMEILREQFAPEAAAKPKRPSKPRKT